MTLIQSSQAKSSIDAYLSNSLNTDQASKQLTDHVERNLPDNVEEEEDTPDAIYDEILRQIRNVRHDSPVQDQLVSLLIAIKGTSSPKRGEEYWKELQPLGMSIRSAWNGELEDNSVEEWTSLNAFVARLNQAEVSAFDDYAVWAFRASAEDGTLAPTPGSGEELSADALNSNVPAAASWALYSSTRLWRLSKKEEEGNRSTRGGPRWEGKTGYSVARWNLWKQRFEELSQRGDLGEEAKKMAAAGIEAMAKVDN